MQTMSFLFFKDSRPPLFIQHDTVDCGPTCLQMISAYYGKLYSLDKLKSLCSITKAGVSLLGISVAAENIGFHATGLKMPVNNLEHDIRLPCIIYWNQKHFVVLYKIRRYKKMLFFFIADPMNGYLKYNESEFCNCWCNDPTTKEGILLTLEPTPSFDIGVDDYLEKNSRLQKFKFISTYLKPYRGYFAQLGIGLLVSSFLVFILPFLTQGIIDFGVNDKNIRLIYLILIAQLFIVIGKTSIEFIRGWILLHLGTRINISLISDYLAKLMNLPIAYFDSKNTGDILQRISDHHRIQDFLTNSSLNAVFSILNILILGAVLLLYNKIVFFIFIIGSFFYVVWTCFFMKRRAYIDNKNFAQNSANQSNLIQMITGMQEIKLNTCEQQQRWTWENIQANIFQLRIKGLTIAQYQESGGILSNEIKNLIITAYVATLVVAGDLTIGAMLTIQYIIGLINSPIDQLVIILRQYQDAQLSLNRLQNIYDLKDEIPKDKEFIRDIPQNADIKVENLCFKYDPLEMDNTLSYLNFTIPFGKKTAIVGLSGSGKTTLLKMLLGFYTPTEGCIRVGDIDLKDLDIREWRKKCGTVMQDGYIFSNTVEYNIAPGAEVINPESLKLSAEISNIDNLISSFPLGYLTKIGVDGRGLSQGQKQRILIARAIYKDSNYLFLDEATNALDANNEKEIINKLDAFLEAKTSVIIAHRLSTVKNADQIIVLNGGRIAEKGDHQSLIKNKGIYYNLIKNQLDI